MSVFDKIKNRLTAKYSDWIRVDDDKSLWTIEDFPYKTGVDENMTKPHCWRCVTVNKCWFANAKDKKPEPIYKQNSLEFDNLLKDGLYHPNCIVRR